MNIDFSEYVSNKKIYDVCQHFDLEGTNYVIDFYYYDWSSMISRGKVPFLLRDGKFIWNVDFKSVTKGDIISTFPDCCNENSVIEINSFVCQTRDVDFEVKLSKKEFLNQWEQKVQQWNTMNISLLDKRRFKKFIKNCSVSPMSAIQAIYMKSTYLIGEFSYGFSCTEKEAVSILKCLGFRAINDERDYTLNGDFYNEVKVICDNVNDMIEPLMRQGHISPVKKQLRSIFGGLSNFFGERRDKIATEIDCTAVRLKPIKRERRKNFRVAICIVIVAGVIVIILFISRCFYSFSDTSLTLQSTAQKEQPLMVFGGALLGAFITGIVTIITTACLIGQSYKVDYHNERLLVLPVFSLKCVDEENFKKYEDDYKKAHYIDIKRFIWDMDKPEMYVIFTNIGKGMAFQTEIHVVPSYPDFTEASTITVGDSVVWRHKKMSLFRPYISYKDIYGNLYSQRFTIDIDDSGFVKIVEQAPELIMRTERARYIQ